MCIKYEAGRVICRPKYHYNCPSGMHICSNCNDKPGKWETRKCRKKYVKINATNAK